MIKYVRETKAGKSISAYVILKGGKQVGTCLVHFSDGGTCLVNLFQSDKAAERSAAAAKNAKRTARDYCFQSASAGGYGYDKFTSALSGMWFDGHELSDHCGKNKKPPKGCTVFPRDAKPPRGYRFANFISGERNDGQEGFLDCYRMQGFEYLRDIGYEVIQAI
jgi:hypothetical protein